MTMSDREWDDSLSIFDKCDACAPLGGWNLDAEQSDGPGGPGQELRVVCGDEPDAPVLTAGFIPFADVDRFRDAVFAVSVAIQARNALPVLVAEIRRLRAALADAQPTTSRGN